MTTTNTPSIAEAARVIGVLTSTPPITLEKKLTTEDSTDEAARVKRFLSLPVRLQEGVLRYGERLQRAYKS